MPDGTLAQTKLTPAEKAYLQSFLDAGDRPGFYMAYYAMVEGDTSYLQFASSIGKDEASLQAKISSFSGTVGAAAFLSNRLLQQIDPKYPGIYTLSQQVAQHALDEISSNDNKFISDNTFFLSARRAWVDAADKNGEDNNLLKDFPGLLLEGGVTGLLAESTLVLTNLLVFAGATLFDTGALPDRTALVTWLRNNGGDRIGEWVAALAGLYVNAAAVPGKDVDAFSPGSGYDIIESVDGEQRMAVDANGHVVAVELDSGKLLPSGKSKYEALDSDINLVLDTVMLANPITVPGISGGKAILAAILNPIFGGAINWSSLTYPVGDDPTYNPAPTAHGATPTPHRSAATTGNDTLSGTTVNIAGIGGDDTIHALAGNDVVFGGTGNDQLFGDSGDDILWGQGDDDTLDGGSGHNILRGGEGTDTAIVDGGAVTINFAAQFGAPDPASPEATATVTGDGNVTVATDTLFGIEHFQLSNYSDIARFGYIGDPIGWGSDVAIDFKSATAGRAVPALYHLDDDMMDFSAAGATVITHSIFGDSTANYGVIVDLNNSNYQTVQYHKDQTPFGFMSGTRILFTAANANSVIGTQYDDELRGNSGRESDGEGYSTLHGGPGNDTLIAAGWESHLNGDAGADSFGIGAAAYIDDAGTDDKVYMGQFRLVGGVNQWWQESGYAYYAPFSMLQTAFPVVGIDIVSLAAVYADIVTMEFARYRMGSDGTLLINIGWGFGGNAAIKNYSINLDSGRGTAGIAVFSASIRTDSFSWDRTKDFINLSLYAGFGHGLPGYDPLVLDLGGDGYQLTTEANSTTWFDFDRSGYAQRTGWVGPEDGLLVRDLNGNGRIDDASELFGTASQSGFDLLAGFDSDHDGAITAADTVYASLQVWQDKNLNGVTDQGELKSLSELGIVSISLSAVAPGAPVSIGQNQISREASFTLADGTTRNIADVVFDVNTANTHYTGDLTVDATAAALPQLAGFGTIKDLRVAMTQDAALKAEVAAFVSNPTSDIAVLKSQAETILYNWAGVQGEPVTPLGTNGFDTRKLAFLEKYAGIALAPRDAQGSPLSSNIAELEHMWNDQLSRLTLRLVVQGPLASTFVGLSYHSDIDLLVADGPASLADVLHRIIVQLPSDATAAAAMWTQWAPLLGAVADGMVRADANVVRSDYLFTQLLRAADGVSQPLALQDLAQGLGIPDLRFGTAGNDTLARGTAGITATYYGGGGDDIFNGGTGQDVYVFGHQIGHAVINDVEPNPAGDRIRFAFLTPEDIKLTRDGNDLLVTVVATGESVRVTGQFAPIVPLGADLLLSSNKGIEDIQFADGSIMEIPEIMAAVGTGTDGDDHLIGTMHADALIAGKGDDLVEGGDGGDLYVFNRGDGDDVYIDQQTAPLLRAADMLILGNDITPQDLHYARSGTNGDDLVISVADQGGSIKIVGQFAYSALGYNDALATNSRIELFAFSTYGDTFSYHDIQQKLISQETTGGDDITRGFGDNDTFAASTGNDVLIGMDGADTYNWGAGAGNDTIREQARYIDVNVGLGGISLTVRADVVQFDGSIDPAHLIFTREYDTDDLTITNTTTGETLTVDGQFNSFQTGVLGAQWFDRVEWFAFADNSAYSWQDVEAMVTTGTAGADRLRGDILADRMVGGAGNDLLSGGGGGDTYVFNAGDGHDTIFDDNQTLIGDGFLTADQTIDTVELGAGIDPADVTFSRDGSAITLTFGPSGDAITLQGQDDYIQTGVFGAIPTSRIEQVRFHDGTVWTWQQLNEKMIAAQTTAGNDVTEGFTLADRFEKSAGDDVMRGGDSGDTYVFGVGAGHDRIEESVSNVLYGDDDSVEFDATVAVADVSVARDGNDLVLTLTSGDTLRVAGEFDLQTLYTWTDVENFRFADGTVWSKADIQHKLLEATAGNDHLIGFYSGDDLDGGAGDDILEGGDGGDTYHFDRGYGHDEIRESVTEVNVGDFDQVVFGPGLVPDDLAIARDGNDLIFTVTDTGETLRVTGQFNFGSWFAWNDVERFTFANGTQWSDIDIATRLTGGTAGDDHLIGTFRSDTLDGKAGDDLLEGGDGSDIYLFGRGYGHDEIRESLSDANLGEDDEVRFGANIALSDLTFTRDGDNLIIAITGTNDTLTLTGEFTYSYPYTWNDVERFTFADGSYITKEQVTQFVLTGTSGNDHIIGFGSNDTLDGGAGDDILEGYDGSDTYRFGVGDGHDTVYETLTDGRTSENDTLSFKDGVLPGDVTVTRDGQDAIFTLTSGDSIRVVGQFNEGYNEFLSFNDVEQAVFADGTVWDKVEIDRRSIHTTAGDDLMLGSRYAQTYDGGAGNDTIYAGNNNDTLIGGTGNDHLEGDGGDDIYIYNLGDGDDVIHDYNWGNDGADRIVFGAGIAPADLRFANNPADATEVVISFANAAGSITIQNQWWGDAGVEFLEFADGTVWDQSQIAAAWIAGQATLGDDTIFGSGSNDQIAGGGGNDHVLAGGGDDQLTGGTGNDRLEGDSGNDTYIYNLGDGNDTIYDYNWNNDQADRIVFGAGITPGNIHLANNGNGSDLVITFDGDAGSILVQSQWQGDAGVEYFEFADGTIWDQAQIAARFVADQATSGNDQIFSPFGGAVDGGAGNDVIHTGDADDVITGGIGDDRLESGYGNDRYIYNLGDGNDTIYDYSWNNDQADRIVFGAGIAPEDVLLDMQANGSLRVTFKHTDGSIAVENQNWGDAGVEFFDFTDGTIWDLSQINAHIGGATGGNDTLVAAAAGAEIWALEGNDRVDGSVSNDSLHGQAGDDAIFGGGGDDVVDGGSGNDQLFGDDDPAASLTPVGDNLVVNGSFESGTAVGGGGWGNSVSDMTGWARANAQYYEQVYSGYAGISASDGSFWLDMDAGGGSGSNMDISQTITGLDAGDTYLLRFDMANRTSADNGGVDVYWNGVLVGSYTDAYSGVHTIALDLVAGGGDNVLTFKGTGWEDNTGASLDNVRLHATVAAGANFGDDILTGGSGDDLIDGGGGTDVAVFAGNFADYVITDNGDGSYTVGDSVAARDGLDTLWRIETLRFADGDIQVGDLAGGGAMGASYQAANDGGPTASRLGWTERYWTDEAGSAKGLHHTSADEFAIERRPLVAHFVTDDMGSATDDTAWITDPGVVAVISDPIHPELWLA